MITTSSETKLIELIQTHRIISQVRGPLSTFSEGGLQEKLNGIYSANKFTQLKFAAELIKINKAFSSQNIDHLALKGPVLSQEIYNDPSERTSRDLDIFIRVDQLDPSLAILKELGYELLTKFSTPKQKQAIVKHYHHMELYHSDENVLLELHWKLSSSKGNSISAEELWSKSTVIPFAGGAIRTLSKEHQLQYLCMHGALHSFFRLQWLTDLHRLFGQISLDEIDALYAATEISEARVCLNASLLLLSELYGFDVPEKITKDADRFSKRIVQISLREIAANTSMDRKKSRWRTTLYNHKVHYSISGIRGLIGSIFSRNVRPKNWQIFAFPDSLFFLNHVFSRFIWLFGKLKRKAP